MELVNDKLGGQGKGRDQNHGYRINNDHFSLINHKVTSKAILNCIDERKRRHQTQTRENLISGATN